MQPKLIVFDMDGVLIDVSGSYREAVRETARIFFSGAEGFDQLPDPLFPLDDLERLKQSGGLNNDWDLTAQVLSLLLACIERPGDFSSPSAASSASEALPKCDVRDLAAYLAVTPSPLSDLLARYGRRNDSRIASCYRGDIGSGNLIKRIFQEIYLGPALFTALYHLPSHYGHREGLIRTERLLMDKRILQALACNHLLAVATGRPKAEAGFSLDHFGLRDCFQRVMTLDDCTIAEERAFAESGKRISMSKPHPFMLDSIAKQLDGRFRDCFFVGDMPDDMLAAGASWAGFQGVGIVLSSIDRGLRREALLRAGARHLIEDFSALPGIIDPDR